MAIQRIIRFRLYVADHTQNSVQAESNLRNFCQEYLPHRHDIELVDVLRAPKRALRDEILLTPTLVVLSPAPIRTIVGTLSHTPTILQTLNFVCRTA